MLTNLWSNLSNYLPNLSNAIRKKKSHYYWVNFFFPPNNGVLSKEVFYCESAWKRSFYTASSHGAKLWTPTGKKPKPTNQNHLSRARVHALNSLFLNDKANYAQSQTVGLTFEDQQIKAITKNYWKPSPALSTLKWHDCYTATYITYWISPHNDNCPNHANVHQASYIVYCA